MTRDAKSNEELRHEICRRSYADLYMDIFEIVKEVPRAGLLKILTGMDMDDAAGHKGMLRSRFPADRLQFLPEPPRPKKRKRKEPPKD